MPKIARYEQPHEQAARHRVEQAARLLAHFETPVTHCPTGSARDIRKGKSGGALQMMAWLHERPAAQRNLKR